MVCLSQSHPFIWHSLDTHLQAHRNAQFLLFVFPGHRYSTNSTAMPRKTPSREGDVLRRFYGVIAVVGSRGHITEAGHIIQTPIHFLFKKGSATYVSLESKEKT